MSMFAPPIDGMKEERVRIEAESMFIDMLGEAMLNSNMPEEKKISVRILLEMKKVKDTMCHKLDELCNPDQNQTEELYAKCKEALALLQSINAELDHFDPTTPPPNNSKLRFFRI